MRPQKGTKTELLRTVKAVFIKFIKMRPRKGTKTDLSIPLRIGVWIYKDETPEGDENTRTSVSFSRQSVIFIKMRPRKGTKTLQLQFMHSFKSIYKDETPEGDENILLRFQSVTARLFIKMRPRKGTKTATLLSSNLSSEHL